MLKRKIVLLGIIVMVLGISPKFTSGLSSDFDGNYQLDLNDLKIFVSFWLQYTTEPEDLDGDGFVNLSDFSILASEWSWCTDTNVSGPWEYKDFTGIGGCNPTDCWFEEDYSDFV